MKNKGLCTSKCLIIFCPYLRLRHVGDLHKRMICENLIRSSRFDLIIYCNLLSVTLNVENINEDFLQ